MLRTRHGHLPSVAPPVRRAAGAAAGEKRIDQHWHPLLGLDKTTERIADPCAGNVTLCCTDNVCYTCNVCSTSLR